METGILLVLQSKNLVKCYIGPINKVEVLAHNCMRPMEEVLIAVYDSWGRQMDKLRSYIGSSMDFKSADLIVVRDINSKCRELAKDHGIYWMDYESREYKTMCLKWLTVAKKQVLRLITVLEKRLGAHSGPLSRRDPYYTLLPDIGALKRTLGSIELGYRMVERRLPIVLEIIRLPYSEERPYRGINSKLRHLLGVDDKMTGTRIETPDPYALCQNIKTIQTLNIEK